MEVLTEKPKRKTLQAKCGRLLVNTTIVRKINRKQTGDAPFEIEDMNFFEKKFDKKNNIMRV